MARFGAGHADEDGKLVRSALGRVRVESGWVAFEDNGRESFIPKDAMCATRPGFGPGTPCYEDAPAGFADALTILDFTPTSDVRRGAALGTVLAGARPRRATPSSAETASASAHSSMRGGAS